VKMIHWLRMPISQRCFPRNALTIECRREHLINDKSFTNCDILSLTM
jgi:hypothetical protein